MGIIGLELRKRGRTRLMNQIGAILGIPPGDGTARRSFSRVATFESERSWPSWRAAGMPT
jgi:hypothetical protein